MPLCTSGYNKRRPCDHCRAQTNVVCRKWKVYLCLSHKRNCYIPYHGEGSDSDLADIDSDHADSGSNHADIDSDHADIDSNHADIDSDHADSDPNIDEQQSEENVSASESPDI